MIKRFLNWIRSMFSHNEQPEKVNTPKKTSNLVKKGRRKKKVSEMSQYEKNFHFLEQRALWLAKHGYALNVHIPSDPKPVKPKSHFKAMIDQCKKLSADGKRDLKVKIKNGTNKYGIKIYQYKGL